MRGSKLHMAWLGDSQGVLVRDGQAVTHMEPHKPDRQVYIDKHLVLTHHQSDIDTTLK